jgi:hypothetical protein
MSSTPRSSKWAFISEFPSQIAYVFPINLFVVTQHKPEGRSDETTGALPFEDGVLILCSVGSRQAIKVCVRKASRMMRKNVYETDRERDRARDISRLLSSRSHPDDEL